MDLKTLKTLHDKAYNANQIPREQASDDLVFYWVTQWDDQLLSDSQLQYRGQFDIVRKAGRQILASLKANPVQPDFKPKDETRTDDAELMDGLYRASDRRLDSQEAYDYASQDSVVCGFGAWELYTEYETNMIGDLNQVIRRRYIPEANNNCFWDPNARRLDRSDANYVSVLYAYSEDGYSDLVEELTGERPNIELASFANPEESYTFPWVAEQRLIYVTTFYNRKKVKDRVITLTDPLGQIINLRESDIEEVFDELVDSGHNVVGEKEIERWEITRYIASGKEILKEDVIAGENIPVIPVYGERAFIEGVEYYEGIVRLAKDPQRLRNFQMSYLADLVSTSPGSKPIFLPEQVQGFEPMYEQSGADNNYPYALQNKADANGNPLPGGPVGELPDRPIPPALAAIMDLSRQAVEDVANPGLPQDIADPDLSGKAVFALQQRLDQQSYIYQHNFKFAKRRDAQVYASMASYIYDAPRTVTIETPDGLTRQVQLMATVVDRQTGESKVINDLTNMEFDVYADIGPSYDTQKEQTREDLIKISATLDPADPLRNTLTLKALELMDGVALDDVRKHVRERLLIQGIKEPENEEDLQVIIQAQNQQSQPDPATLLAMAENKKGDAAIMKEERQAFKDRQDAISSRTKNQIDAYRADTDRQSVIVDAQEAGAKISNTNMDTAGKIIDNQQKKVNLQASVLDARIKSMPTEQLIAEMGF